MNATATAPPRLSSAETARAHGWGVGTRLFGAATKHEGWVVIEITAIGERQVLAKALKAQRYRANEREGSWVFDSRAWSLLADQPVGEI